MKLGGNITLGNGSINQYGNIIKNKDDNTIKDKAFKFYVREIFSTNIMLLIEINDNILDHIKEKLQ